MLTTPRLKDRKEIDFQITSNPVIHRITDIRIIILDFDELVEESAQLRLGRAALPRQ